MSTFESPMAALFGKQLVTKTGVVDTAAHLSGKVVGIYFSAHWCGPCRSFTPVLAKHYAAYQAAGKPFEVVFASSDKSQTDFDKYFGSMPWSALPFEARTEKEALSAKYGVRGIPTLVLVDENGETITKDGRAAVSGDPTGEAFPWKPKTLKEAIGNDLVGPDGAATTVEAAMDGCDHLLLYFSAHWCGPCRGFTPSLAKFYAAQAKAKKFALVFVSSDKDQRAFDEYFGEMPWHALPFARRDDKEALSSALGVEGIPTLAVLDKDFNVITTSARGDVDAAPEALEFPWPPKPMGDLARGVEAAGYDINAKPALVLFMEHEDDGAQATMKKALLGVAEASVAKGKTSADGPDFICFAATEAGGIADRVRELTGLQGKTEDPLLVMLDIPDKGGYYVSEATDFDDGANIEEFVAGWRAKSLDRKQLSG